MYTSLKPYGSGTIINPHRFARQAPDNRIVHIKLARIEGQTRFITIMPPSPIEEDEMVWARKQNRWIPIYEGPSLSVDYAFTRLDQGE